MWDTVLAYKIDQKTGLIDLYNMQRRKMSVPLGPALRGSSILFDTHFYGDLTKSGKYIRWGINSENNFSIPSFEINNIPKPKTLNKMTWNVSEMGVRECSKALTRYPGAYVKDPIPGIYDTGIVSDLDAARLYPSMINQNNIGLNTFFGRLIPAASESHFRFFGNFFGQTGEPTDKVYTRFLDVSEKFVENMKESEDDEETDNKFKNKNDAKQQYYYIMSYLFKKILQSGFTLEELCNPQTLQQYIVSKTYFNNLIEAMETTTSKDKEYNDLAYKYIINQEELSGPIRIIEHYNDPTYRIITINGEDFPDYLKENKLGVTISGTLFKTHENELSIFYNFLNELYTLRNQYKKQMYTYPKGSAGFNEFNRRQSTTKVIMNSTYGLLGMSTFRYSNKWLAKSITTSGRLALKTAQFYAEKYLETLE